MSTPDSQHYSITGSRTTFARAIWNAMRVCFLQNRGSNNNHTTHSQRQHWL